MRKFLAAAIFVGAFGVADIGLADQVSVNIAYPLNGGGYTISPRYPMLPVSFSVTCRDLEDHNVEWGYQKGSVGETLGKAKFRGSYSGQFLQKFDEGEWIVWVRSDCGSNRIRFKVAI